MNAALRRIVGTAAVLVTALVESALVPAAARAEEVWLISTREIPSCSPPAEARPQYWHLAAEGQWAAADRAAFLASDDPAVPTVFFLHGNRSDADDAVQTGWDVYQCLVEQAGGRPLRLVIWSWPADRIPGRLRPDVRIKAARSDVESRYLAEAIDAIRPGAPVCLVGYSFGARTICGALTLLAGGQFAGHVLERQRTTPRAPIRAVLIAAAIDDTALAPYGSSAGALDQVDRVLLTRNAADHALRWYRHLERWRGPAALGFRGPACAGEPDAKRTKIELVDVGCEVGRNHTWDGYLAAPAIRSRLAWYAFLQPTPENSVGPASRRSGGVSVDCADADGRDARPTFGLAGVPPTPGPGVAGPSRPPRP
jgi:hypothetical protein